MGRRKRRITNPPLDRPGKKIIPPRRGIDQLSNLGYPIFCFHKMHRKWSVDCCSEEDKANLSSTLFRLSKLTWQQIQTTHKKGLGSEKIYINCLNAPLPPDLTEDVSYLLGIKFSDEKR